MTALAVSSSVIILLVIVAGIVVKLRTADTLARRLVSRAGADRGVEHATSLGLVDPESRRRWSKDRKPVPVDRVLYHMPHHR